MDSLKAILVDDEEAARNVLEQLLLRNCPDIDILQKCKDVPSAARAIEKLKPDVVFLDVEMPNYAGYELLDFIEQASFEIIFVTAYDQYAIKAFELNAVEYLVKPIHRTRLVAAVDKLKARLSEKSIMREYQLLKESLQKKRLQHIVIPELGNKRVIQLDSIVAIEAKGAYSNIHIKNEKPFLVSKNLKYFEETLPKDASFFRAHKTWIVNLDCIESYSLSDLTIQLNAGIAARLSRFKKNDFVASIG